jgi:hypothetical protein
MAAHTPGPWTLDRPALEIRAEHGQRRIAAVAIPGKNGMSVVADCAVAEANAYLIATAPQLRAFVQEIAAMEQEDFEEDCGVAFGMVAELIRRAQQLVAKADGAT